MQIDQVTKAMNAQILFQGNQFFSEIGTDTRAPLAGKLFIALKGENYDAHDYIINAIKSEASGIVIHQKETWNSEIQNLCETKNITVLLVKDTLRALQMWGNFCRRQSSAKIIAITGSNGKTTSKEFAAQLLSNYRKTHFSSGSFNNHWGVPITLSHLEPQPDCQAAIVEMGMNHAGELTELVRIADPDVVVCTTVGRAHIEFFGTEEKIAEAKEEIYLKSKNTCTRIYNLDNPHTKKMHDRCKQIFPQAKVITFSSHDERADVQFRILEMSVSNLSLDGRIGRLAGSVNVPVFGEQNVVNLMVAACIGLSIGLSPEEIWTGLKKCKTNWGRNQLIQFKNGAKGIFDGYNANPDSMNALLSNIKKIRVAGNKIGVFGQMLELGENSAQYHYELGKYVGEVGFSGVYFLGSDAPSFAEGLNSVKYDKKSIITDTYKDSLALDLASVLKDQDIVVIKGSRGMKMERFLAPCDPINFNTNKESSI